MNRVTSLTTELSVEKDKRELEKKKTESIRAEANDFNEYKKNCQKVIQNLNGLSNAYKAKYEESKLKKKHL